MSLLTTAGVFAGTNPRNCDPERLRVFDPDTELINDQCIGISDGSVVFEPGGGVQLDGKYDTPGTGGGVGGFDQADLMKSIRDENRNARSGRHVILFYAGELTGVDKPETALNGLRELAGVHAKQKFLNGLDGAGDADLPKVVVEAANGGHLMKEQKEAVKRIIEHAREYPRQVLGVVGFSRDNKFTHESVKRLFEAGLNVVAPQNSDDHLAAHTKNFVSLAATNQEQARAFRDAIEAGRVDVEKGNALILTPSGADQDIYSRQQAEAAQKALDETAKLTARTETYGDLGEVTDKLCDWNARVLYFTGRAEKLTELVDAVHASKCRGEKLALLTGDDVTKSIAMEGRKGLPEATTLYYASLAAPNHTLPSSPLLDDLADIVGDREPLKYADPVFEDGTIALAYDATTVLYEAGEKADFRPEFISGELLKIDRAGAGGQIDLSWERRREPKGHTVSIFKVSKEAEPGAQATCEVYYREPGEDRPAPESCSAGS